MMSLQPPCAVVAGAAELPTHSEIKNAEQHSEKHATNRTIHWEELPMATTQKWHTDRTIQWEELPKRATEVNTSEEEMNVTTVPTSPGAAIMLDINNEMKTNTEAEMEYPATGKQTHECLLASKSTLNNPSTDNEIITTGCALHLKGQADLLEEMGNLSSFHPSEQCVPYYVKPDTEYKQSTFLEACPVMTNIAGHPSMQKADNKYWSTIHQPLWEKQIKQESVLLETNKLAKDMKGVVSLAQSCPRESHIFGFPSVPKSRMNNVEMTNMVSLLTSKVSRILGFQSSHNLEEWTVSKEPLFQPRVKEKQVSITDICERDKRAMKTIVSFVPSCPKETLTPGFPSHPHPITVYCAPYIISLFTLCSQVSKIPGFPSVDEDMNLGWVIKEGSLLKRLLKKGDLFDRSNDNEKTIMKNMVSCVPSCPKESSIHGFPSIPNSQMACYSLNVVHLFPLCPLDSTIPGFSSVEGNKKKGWVVEHSFMQRPEKNIKFRINSSPVNIDKPNNMLRLVPACSGQSKIPGFPSLPQYNMLSLVPVCPKVSSFPGFASFEGASKFLWIFQPHTLCDKLSKETVFVIHSRNEEEETAKTMWAFAPSCPEASRIPGFPSAPQTKSKIKSGMITFIQSCSSSSSLKGFASMTTTPSTEWLSGTKIIFRKPQKKRTEMIMPHGGQDWLYCYNIKSMVTLVTSCPKEARVQGFPSAQAVNRPPNMVSLYTSAPCVSRVPGFPSARTLSSECMKIQTRTTLRKSFFEKLQNETVLLIAKFPGKQEPKEDEMKYMIAMAPTCPHLTQIPGLPSISQFNPIEKQRITTEELSHAQSTQSYLKDTRNPGVPSISVSSPSTDFAYGETFSVLRSKSYSLFLFFYFFFHIFSSVCFLMTEEKSKDGAKQNIDLSVDTG